MKWFWIILVILFGAGALIYQDYYLADIDAQLVSSRLDSNQSEHQHGQGYEPMSGTSAPALSPDQALKSFRIAPDFRIELVAAEPLVVDPVAMTWDDEGHLYVVEMRGFMRDVEGTGETDPVGRVVVLFDDNGDGLMDRNRVFADKLVNPRAIAMVKGGVLIAEPPSLFYCPDSDKNYQCDKKIRVGAYGDNKGGTLEHLENGLLYGLDNWLYNAKSDRKLQFKKGELIEKATLFRGQWGISQDSQGRFYYNNNSNFITTDFYPAEYVHDTSSNNLPAGIGESLTDDDEVYPVRETPGVNRAYVDGTLRPDKRLIKPTAVSGLTVYRGGQLPADYDGDVFVTEPAANAIAHFKIESNGLAMRAKHQLYRDEDWGKREFLASTDERFRPVDIKTGPDSALYVIDMYRGLIQHKAYLTDYLKKYVLQHQLDKPLGMGRIYRIVHNQGEPIESTPQLPVCNGFQLACNLASGNSWQRDTAQRLIVQEQNRDTVDILKAMLREVGVQGAIHVLWTLQGLDALDREDILATIDREESVLSIQALRAGHDLLAVDDMLGLLSGGDLPLPLQQQLVFNLQPWADLPVVQKAFVTLLDSNLSNPYLSQAILASIKGHEVPFLSLLLAQTKWQIESDDRNRLLVAIAKSSYLSARQDLRGGELLLKPLGQLLALVSEIAPDNSWHLQALLEGVASSVTYRNFTPAMMPAKPELLDVTGLSPELLNGIKLAGKVFTWPGDDREEGIEPLTEQQKILMAKGAVFYNNCANCHGKEGGGVPGLAPGLVNSDWVLGPPEWLGRIILQGVTGPIEVDGEVWNGTMPGHIQYPGFDDSVFSGLMTYIRRSWGNTASAVDLEVAESIRHATAGRSTPWTVAELEAIPFQSAFSAYLGTYKVDFMSLALSEKVGKMMAVPSRGEPFILRHVYEQLFADSAGGPMKLDFQLGDDGDVIGVKVEMGENSVFMPKVD